MFQAVLPQLFIEIYLSGVNQLYDLEIDKVWDLLLAKQYLDRCIINYFF